MIFDFYRCNEPPSFTDIELGQIFVKLCNLVSKCRQSLGDKKVIFRIFAILKLH